MYVCVCVSVKCVVLCAGEVVHQVMSRLNDFGAKYAAFYTSASHHGDRERVCYSVCVCVCVCVYATYMYVIQTFSLSHIHTHTLSLHLSICSVSPTPFQMEYSQLRGKTAQTKLCDKSAIVRPFFTSSPSTAVNL